MSIQECKMLTLTDSSSGGDAALAIPQIITTINGMPGNKKTKREFVKVVYSTRKHLLGINCYKFSVKHIPWRRKDRVWVSAKTETKRATL